MHLEKLGELLYIYLCVFVYDYIEIGVVFCVCTCVVCVYMYIHAVYMMLYNCIHYFITFYYYQLLNFYITMQLLVQYLVHNKYLRNTRD